MARTHTGKRIDTLLLCALHRCTVQLSCDCGHVRLLDGVALWWLFERRRWPDALTEVGRRFFCDACWKTTAHKARPKVLLSELAPAGRQPDYPDERVWKRMVSRYRS